MNDRKITIIPHTIESEDLYEAKAINLRTVDERQSVESVGKPIVIMTTYENEHIVGSDIRDGNTYYFSERGNRFMIAGVKRTDGTIRRIDKSLFEFSGQIRQVCSSGQFLVISTDDGLLYAYFDGSGYKYLGKAPQFPVIAFGTTDTTEIVAQIPAAKLKCQYERWESTLQPDDTAMMTRATNSAIDKIKAISKSEFRSIQPLMLRTALRLWDDTLLWSPTASLAGNGYTTPSVLAVATALPDGNYRIEGSQLKATAWKLSATLVRSGIGNWKPFIKSVEIYATAEQNIFSGTATFRCETKGQGSQELYLRITPDNYGTERAIRTIPTDGKYRLLLSITDIESFMNGKINAFGAATVTDSAGGNLADRTYAIDVADNCADTEYTPYIIGRTPKILATIGNRCFVADTSLRLPNPPRFEEICEPSGLKATTATATIAVELLSTAGKSTVVKSSVYGCWAERLNGLITYPDARATKITVDVTAGGKRYRWASKMQPNFNGNFAYAISDTGFFELKQAEVSDTITASNTVFYEPESLFAAIPGNPLQWERCDKANNKGIRAIMASSHYGSSWLLGKHSVYLFATEGIYLLSFDRSGHCTGGNLISQRTVKDRKLTISTPDGIAFVDSNGVLCRLTGSKVKPTDITIENATALVFSPLYNETLILSEEGLTVVENNGRFYRMKTSNTTILNLGSTSLLATGNTISSFERETAEKTEFELLTQAVEIPHGKVANRVIWDISATDADVELTVYGDNSRSCCGRVLSRLKVTGNINSPLLHRLPPAHIRTVRFSVKGTGIVRIYPIILRI